MICKRCGKALPSEGFVCKNCGMLMSEEQIKEQKKYIKENNLKLQPKFISEQYGKKDLYLARDNSSNKMIGLITIIGILILVFIVAVLVYLN